MPWITPTQNTVLKLRPVQSTQLGTNEKRDRRAGDKLAIISAKQAENNHWKVLLAGDLTIGGRKVRSCYLWPGHWQDVGIVYSQALTADRKQSIEQTSGIVQREGDRVLLPVGYRSQMDNANNPSGSCNVTSCAMVLDYWGIKGNGSGQFEDQLYQWMIDQGLSRHDPNHLRQLLQHFGLNAHFTTRASIEEIKQAIDKGIPVVVHGWFTVPSGHIVLFVGYDSKGFIAHDPYGEWTPNGYDRNDSSNQSKGKAIHYSFGLIDRLCLPDGGCWAHFATRPNRPIPAQSIVNTPTTEAQTTQHRKFKPQELRLNSIAVSVIEHFEGLELKQYYCSANVSTIGLGSTIWFDGGSVPIGATITREQARQLFDRDAAKFVRALQELVDVPISARQCAALFSFTYNTGIGAFEGSTLRKRINDRADDASIVAAFKMWVKANGQTIPGLVRRRNAEGRLWLDRDDWMQAGFD